MANDLWAKNIHHKKSIKKKYNKTSNRLWLCLRLCVCVWWVNVDGICHRNARRSLYSRWKSHTLSSCNRTHWAERTPWQQVSAQSTISVTISVTIFYLWNEIFAIDIIKTRKKCLRDNSTTTVESATTNVKYRMIIRYLDADIDTLKMIIKTHRILKKWNR